MNVKPAGRRAGRRVSRLTEARRILTRAADLRFPTHRGVPRG